MFCCKKNTHKKRLEEARVIIQSRDSRIKKFLDTLTFSNPDIDSQFKSDIVQKACYELRSLVINEKITSVDLLKIFLERSYTIGLKYNALADICHERAIAEAETRDMELKNCPKDKRETSLGSLFGVPISIKENFKMKGTISCLGYIALAGEDKRFEEDSLIIYQIIKNGGIPFVKTNVPLFLMNWECLNNLFGETPNPYDLTRTPGGSSGGEGFLISSRCSPMGIGTDIGGSVRVPCAFCGLYGMKYTSSRLGYSSMYCVNKSGYSGSIIRAVTGPMATCVEDCITMTKVLLNWETKFDDGTINYKKVDIERLNKFDDKLTIAYCEEWKILESCPSGRRAVNEAVGIIKSMGHNVVKFDYDLSEPYRHTINVISGGGKFDTLQDLLQGEELIGMYKYTMI